MQVINHRNPTHTTNTLFHRPVFTLTERNGKFTTITDIPLRGLGAEASVVRKQRPEKSASKWKDGTSL